MEHQRQLDLINRAKAHGMYVVGWYLPMLEDVDTDLHRLVAAATRLPLDGLGVDIESREVADVAERNRRLLDLRSEEHTSELQSLMRISYAVFCLKKNKNNNRNDEISNK